MRNVATCLTCGEVLESTHRHDYRTCNCPPDTRVMVDGGHDYVRRGWGAYARWTESADGTGPEEPAAMNAAYDARAMAAATPRPLFGEDLED